MNFQAQPLKMLVSRKVIREGLEYSSYLTGKAKEELDGLNKFAGHFVVKTASTKASIKGQILRRRVEFLEKRLANLYEIILGWSRWVQHFWKNPWWKKLMGNTWQGWLYKEIAAVEQRNTDIWPLGRQSFHKRAQNPKPKRRLLLELPGRFYHRR